MRPSRAFTSRLMRPPAALAPGLLRCSKCCLATLIVKAFKLEPYQFPGRASLADNTHDVLAKIPTSATQEEFLAMLQNLLKDRFLLTWHFQEKRMKGYDPAIAKNGPKLSESTGASLSPPADQHRSGQSESHNHNGAVVFGTSASYRALNQTTADLARVLSDQLGLPVDDETGLAGKYDISLRWSSNAASHAGNHADDAF